MARTTRIIWGKWDCSNCSTKGISAEPPAGETQPRCPGCGSPREKEAGEASYLDNARDGSGRVLNANVADTAEEVAIATAGADWTCRQCGGDNRAGNPQCEGCGAARSGVSGSRASRGGAAGPDAAGSAEPAAPGVDARVGAAMLAGVGALVLVPCCGLIGFGAYKNSYSEELPGTISSLRWQHTVDVQTFTPVVSGGWQAGLVEEAAVMPVNGAGERGGVTNIRGCAMRHHHDEQYACGTENVCVQHSRSVDDGQDCHEVCTTSDNGNGSFTETCDDVCSTRSHTEYYDVCHDETKYCSRPIEAEWCTYDTWQWSNAGQVELHGENPATGTTALPWPTQDAGGLQRTVRGANYQVEYTIPEEQGPKVTSDRVSDEQEFLALRLGQPVRATVGWDGNVLSVHR